MKSLSTHPPKLRFGAKGGLRPSTIRFQIEGFSKRASSGDARLCPRKLRFGAKAGLRHHRLVFRSKDFGSGLRRARPGKRSFIFNNLFPSSVKRVLQRRASSGEDFCFNQDSSFLHACCLHNLSHRCLQRYGYAFFPSPVNQANNESEMGFPFDELHACSSRGNDLGGLSSQEQNEHRAHAMRVLSR